MQEKIVGSILVEGSKATKIKTISTTKIQFQYRFFLGVDVSRFFKNKKEIGLYKCEKSGFEFFLPFDIAGDGKFYEDLSKNEWYYMPWKWEHDITEVLISKEQKVLEVGCAHGTFISKINEKVGVSTVGLELNEEAVKTGKIKNIDIRNEMIQEHALNNTDSYDVVCSFQVLEHIAEPKSFLESCVRALKKGGKLIVSVPNNDSFISEDSFHLLNMPPHHMGLWTPSSLAYLEKEFPIKLKETHIEPFQNHHIDYYKRLKLIKRLKSKLVVSLIFKAGIQNLFLSDQKLKEEVKDIAGQSVLVVFEKI